MVPRFFQLLLNNKLFFGIFIYGLIINISPTVLRIDVFFSISDRIIFSGIFIYGLWFYLPFSLCHVQHVNFSIPSMIILIFSDWSYMFLGVYHDTRGWYPRMCLVMLHGFNLGSGPLSVNPANAARLYHMALTSVPGLLPGTPINSICGFRPSSQHRL